VRSLLITGAGGRLRSGSRTVSELGAWSAAASGDGHFRVTVGRHAPDPYWWEHHDPARLALELAFGKHGLRGRAVLLSPDPLILTLTQDKEP